MVDLSKSTTTCEARPAYDFPAVIDTKGKNKPHVSCGNLDGPTSYVKRKKESKAAEVASSTPDQALTPEDKINKLDDEIAGLANEFAHPKEVPVKNLLQLVTQISQKLNNYEELTRQYYGEKAQTIVKNYRKLRWNDLQEKLNQLNLNDKDTNQICKAIDEMAPATSAAHRHADHAGNRKKTTAAIDAAFSNATITPSTNINNAEAAKLAERVITDVNHFKKSISKIPRDEWITHVKEITKKVSAYLQMTGDVDFVTRMQNDIDTAISAAKASNTPNPAFELGSTALYDRLFNRVIDSYDKRHAE